MANITHVTEYSLSTLCHFQLCKSSILQILPRFNAFAPHNLVKFGPILCVHAYKCQWVLGMDGNTPFHYHDAAPDYRINSWVLSHTPYVLNLDRGRKEIHVHAPSPPPLKPWLWLVSHSSLDPCMSPIDVNTIIELQLLY